MESGCHKMHPRAWFRRPQHMNTPHFYLLCQFAIVKGLSQRLGGGLFTTFSSPKVDKAARTIVVEKDHSTPLAKWTNALWWRKPSVTHYLRRLMPSLYSLTRLSPPPYTPTETVWNKRGGWTRCGTFSTRSWCSRQCIV